MLGDRLRELRKKANLKQSDLAKALNVGDTTIGNYENSNRKPDIETVIKIAKYFNVTTDYLLDTTDRNVDLSNKISAGKQISIPIIGTISAGTPILADENIIGYAPMDSRFLNRGEVFYLEVKGDSMNNCINDKDMILVSKQSHVENGEIAVVLVNGNEATVKKVYVEGHFMTLYPDSTNEKHEPKHIDLRKEHAEIIGLVLHSGRLINPK